MRYLKLILLLSLLLFSLNSNATNVGTAETYTTLKAAFDAINAGTLTGDVTLVITSDLTETATASLNASGTGSANYTSVTIYPTGAARTITNDAGLTGTLIQLNGADNVTFDGRIDQTGSSKELTIDHTTAGGSAITLQFIGDATSNTVQYCNLYGSGTSVLNGTVELSTASAGGNDNNTFSYCLFDNSAAGLPDRHIYSSGTASNANSGVTISNTQFVDVDGIAIYLDAENDNWTITDCDFYQSSSFTPSVDNYMIDIDDGADYTITNNHFGGQAVNCGGSAYTLDASDEGYKAIEITASSGTVLITGNTIANIDVTISGGFPTTEFVGMEISGGTSDYSVSGNTFGDLTSTGSIQLTSDNSVGFRCFYNNQAAGGGDVSFESNSIGSLTLDGTGSTDMILVGNGSNADGKQFYSYNTIGGTVANSIQQSNSGVGSDFFGIEISDGESSGGSGNFNEIFNNTLQNINLSSSVAATVGLIYITGTFGGGDWDVENNTFHDINSNKTNSFYVFYADPGGTKYLDDFSGNNIYNITCAGEFVGVYIEDITNRAMISNNTIGSATDNNMVLSKDDQHSAIFIDCERLIDLQNNVIQEFNCTSTGTNASFYGVVIKGTNTEILSENNTIRNIDMVTTRSGTASPWPVAALAGVTSRSSEQPQDISGFTIENLNLNSTDNVATKVAGIAVNGSFTGSTSATMTKNIITGLKNRSTSTTAEVVGIYVEQEYWDVYNNVILLDNGGETNSPLISGIKLDGADTKDIIHNTVKIYGTASSGSANSFCLYHQGSSIVNSDNNVYQNVRTGGSGTHYAVYENSGDINSINDYLQTSAAPIGYHSAANRNTLADWNAIADNSACVEGTITINNTTGRSNDSAIKNAGNDHSPPVNDDYSGKNRHTSTPWIGAYEGNTRYYVNDSGTGTDVFCNVAGQTYNGTTVTGTSPDDPVLLVQAILDNYVLYEGDTIFIDGGTYSETGIIPTNNDDGFTYLGAGIDVTIFDAAGGSQVFGVVSSSTSSDNLIWKDMTIQNVSNAGDGGGIDYSNTSSTNSSLQVINVKFDNCDVTGSNDGGGLYISNSTGAAMNITVSGCTFQNCDAGGDGGAFAWKDYKVGSDLTVTNCTFTSNSAGDGGAFYSSDATADDYATATFTSCSFTNNNADGFDTKGGAVYLEFGNHQDNFGDWEFYKCTFQGNTAEYTSGTDGDGGAIAFENATVKLENCLLIENSAEVAGGAIWLHNDDAHATNDNGEETKLIVLNSTIADNVCNDANNAGGIYHDGAGLDCATTHIGSTYIFNSIVYGNTNGTPAADDLEMVNGNASYEYFQVWNSVYGTATGVIDFYESAAEDPLFVDAASDNYEVMPNSPAIKRAVQSFYSKDDCDIFNPTTAVAPSDDLNGNDRDNQHTSGCYEQSCTEPNTQASAVSFYSINQTTMTVAWTRGDGNGVVVVIAAGGAPSSGPTSGAALPTDNAAWAAGDDLGGGSYVIYEGTGTSVNVTGLTAGTQYYVQVYEYNTAGTCYATDPGEGSTYTLSGTFYYVDDNISDAGQWTSGTAFDDAACGAITDPCRTVKYVVESKAANLNPGDIIYVDKGTYTDTDITPDGSGGDIDDNFYIQGFSKETTIFDDSGTDRFFNNSVGNIGQITFNDITIKDYTVAGDGGAIFLTTGTSLVLDNVNFENCSATGFGGDGGAIRMPGGSNLSVDSCTFTNCSAAEEGGAISHISLAAGGESNISYTTFNSNSAEVGGAYSTFTTHKSIFTYCTFNSNSATGGTTSDGGAINIDAFNDGDVTSLIINKCSFTNNTSEDDGSAIAMTNGGYANIVNSLFANNTSTTGNGVIIFDETNANAMSAELNHLTIADNTATTAGRVGGLRGESGSAVDVQNTISYNNTKLDFDIDASNNGTVSYSIATVSGKVQADSKTNMTYGDPTFLTPGSDYHLTDAVSNAIDIGTGNLADDIEDNVRINPDIGAYEAANCTLPTTQATGTSTAYVSNTSASITYTAPADGDEIIIVVRPTADAVVDPTDGNDYSDYTGLDYSAAPTLSGNAKVVWAGANTSATKTVTNLDCTIDYTFDIYTRTSAGDCYNKSEVSTAYTAFRACAISFSCEDNSNVDKGSTDQAVLQAQITVTGSTGTLVLTDFDITSDNTADADVSGVELWYNTSDNFGTAASLGTTTLSGGKATFTGLTQSLATNGSNHFVYASYDVAAGATGFNTLDMNVAANDITIASDNFPAALADAGCDRTINCVAPTNEVTNLDTSSVDATQMTITWTKGADADQTLIVIKEGAAPDDPVSGTNYTANATFESGTDVGSNSYVVYKDNGTSVTVVGLDPNRTYYVEAWSMKTTDNCFIGTNDNDNWTTDVLKLYVNDGVMDGSELWCTAIGNDATGTGSKSAPYLSLEQAFLDNVVDNGAIIYVDQGTYSTTKEESIDPGNEDLDFTIQGAGIALVTIDPAYVSESGALGMFRFTNNGNVTIQDMTLNDGDHDTNTGGTIYYEEDGSNTLTLRRIVMSNGEGASSGGGVYLTTSGGTSNLVVDSCTFTNLYSAASGGGAMYLNGGAGANYTITQSRFDNNSSAGSSGAAIYSNNGNLSMTNCLLYENSNSAGDGIVFIKSGTNVVNFCTFADNSIAATYDCLTLDVSGTLDVKNSIFYNNVGDDIEEDGGTVTLDESVYQSVEAGVAVTNSITSDPEFVNAAADNYHLKSTSPAVDNADNNDVAITVDYDGLTRTDPNEDMGCYEGDGCGPATASLTQASGVNFTAVGVDNMTINWTRGNGAGVLVVVKEGSAPEDPTGYAAYSASTDWDVPGTDVGTNSYVVYKSTGTSVTITNLTPEATYYVEVWEYSADPGCYKSTPATGNQQTLACDLVWDGSTDGDWATPANWDLNTVPTNECNVTITTAGTPPIIDTEAAVCKDLTINNSATLTADITSGSFQIWGDIVNNGTFASGASLAKTIELHGVGKTIQGSGTFVDGSPDLTFETKAGDMTLASNVALDNLTINGGNFALSTFTLETEDLTLTSGTFNQNSGTAKIGSNLTRTAGTFTASTGTTHFTGTIAQTIPSTGFSYYNLTVDGSDAGNQTLGDGATVSVGNNLVIANPNTAGNIVVTDDDVSIAAAFSLGTTGNAVTLNVTDNGRIYRATSGTGFTMGNNTAHQINVTDVDATDTDAWLGNYTDSPLQFYGTVTYNSGTDNQIVMAANYYNLVISGGNNGRTGAGAINVANDLTVNAGTFTLGGTTDVDRHVVLNGGSLSGSTHTLLVAGNFITNGGSFTQGTSTVNFNGGAAQYVNVQNAATKVPNAVNFTFYNLTVSSGADVFIYCDIDNNDVSVTNTLNISGTLNNIEK